jgi:Protein of unknown function (DUF3105)
MSSRQEEKERRRRERLAAEQAAEAAAARKRRMGYLVGGVLVGAAIAAVVIAVAAGGGGKSSSSKKPSASQAKLDTAAKTAAAAAGCTVETFPSEGRQHTEGKVAYKTNPPTSGNHNPVPASDGIYDPGGTPQVEKLVHALEHGRIEIQYHPGLPAAQVAQLQTVMKEPVTSTPVGSQSAGFAQLLYQNTTGMPYAVAATAWTHRLACPQFKGAATLAALRAFRAAYILKGPEFLPVPE